MTDPPHIRPDPVLAHPSSASGTPPPPRRLSSHAWSITAAATMSTSCLPCRQAVYHVDKLAVGISARRRRSGGSGGAAAPPGKFIIHGWVAAARAPLDISRKTKKETIGPVLPPSSMRPRCGAASRRGVTERSRGAAPRRGVAVSRHGVIGPSGPCTGPCHWSLNCPTVLLLNGAA